MTTIKAAIEANLKAINERGASSSQTTVSRRRFDGCDLVLSIYTDSELKSFPQLVWEEPKGQPSDGCEFLAKLELIPAEDRDNEEFPFAHVKALEADNWDVLRSASKALRRDVAELS